MRGSGWGGLLKTMYHAIQPSFELPIFCVKMSLYGTQNPTLQRGKN